MLGCAPEQSGGRLITSTVTVATLPASVPSNALYVNVSVPEKPAFGLYVTVPSAFSVVVPCAGAVRLVTDSASPSASLSFASTSTVTGVFLNVLAAYSTATGGVFFTSTVTVATLLSEVPSFAVYVNVSVPRKPRFGV